MLDVRKTESNEFIIITYCVISMSSMIFLGQNVQNRDRENSSSVALCEFDFIRATRRIMSVSLRGASLVGRRCEEGVGDGYGETGERARLFIALFRCTGEAEGFREASCGRRASGSGNFLDLCSGTLCDRRP